MLLYLYMITIILKALKLIDKTFEKKRLKAYICIIH